MLPALRAGRLFSFAVAAGTVVAFAPAVSFAGEATYSVRPGDSLWTISQRHHTTVEALRSVNSLSSTLLRPGQVLRLSGPPPATKPAPKAAPKPATPATYTVRRGDSLWKIGQRTGTSVAALRAANNLSGNLLHVGQVLRLSGPPPAQKQAPKPAPKPAPQGGGQPTPSPLPRQPPHRPPTPCAAETHSGRSPGAPAPASPRSAPPTTSPATCSTRARCSASAALHPPLRQPPSRPRAHPPGKPGADVDPGGGGGQPSHRERAPPALARPGSLDGDRSRQASQGQPGAGTWGRLHRVPLPSGGGQLRQRHRRDAGAAKHWQLDRQHDGGTGPEPLPSGGQRHCRRAVPAVSAR